MDEDNSSMVISPIKQQRPPRPPPPSSSADAAIAAAVADAGMGADSDSSDSDDSDDDFFDRMAAVAVRKGEDEEVLGQKAEAAAAAAAAGPGPQRRMGAGQLSSEEAADEQWIEAVLHHAATTSAIRDEADPVWWDDILTTVALSGPSPAFGRSDGAYPVDSEAKGLLLRKFFHETRGMPRAAPFVRGRPLVGGDWAWYLDNLAQPKAALGVRGVGSDSSGSDSGRREVFLHAMETGAVASLLACVLLLLQQQQQQRGWTVLHLDPLHEAAVTEMLGRAGLEPQRRRGQRLYAVPPSQPPPRAPSPLEADGRRDASNVVSPPKPPLKMPRDRGEHSVLLRRLQHHEVPREPALLGVVGAPGVEAHGLYYESELACCVAAEPTAAWVRGLWTSPSYRGRGFERRLLFHLLRQWRTPVASSAVSAVASAASNGAVVRGYLPLMWVDETAGGAAPLPDDALAGLGFAPIEGVGGAGVTLECGAGGDDGGYGDGMALG